MIKHKAKAHKTGTFKSTKFRASDYITDNGYIRALYLANKEKINLSLFDKSDLRFDEKMQSRLAYRRFRAKMKDIIETDGLSRSDAAYAYSRTRTFLSREEIGIENIKAHISAEQSRTIRKLSGQYKKKIDWNNIRWDDQKGMYVTGDGSVGLVYSYPDDSEHESIVEVFDLNQTSMNDVWKFQEEALKKYKKHYGKKNQI